MSEINTEYLQKCIDTLEKSYQMLQCAKTDSIKFSIFLTLAGGLIPSHGAAKSDPVEALRTD